MFLLLVEEDVCLIESALSDGSLHGSLLVHGLSDGVGCLLAPRSRWWAVAVVTYFSSDSLDSFGTWLLTVELSSLQVRMNLLTAFLRTEAS